MKALKEKRVSLRSLFRRSLVILSILALAFMACGGDDNSTSETPPPDTGTPPPVATPQVVSIVILQQPVNESYQGLPPDLTGVIAEVYWDNGKREVVSDTSKFFSLPGYCDYANLEYGVLTSNIRPFVMALGYVGSQAISASLQIPYVIPADTIEITGNAKEKWYADRRPDFTGLTYEVTFKEGYFTKADVELDIAQVGTAATSVEAITGLTALDPVTGTVGEFSVKRKNTDTTDPDYLVGKSRPGRDGAQAIGVGSGAYKKVALPMTDAYPKVVLTQAKSDNKVTVRIGSFTGLGGTGLPSSTTPLVPAGSGVGFPNGGTHHNDIPFVNTATQTMIMSDGIQTTFAIKEYLEVSGVEYVSASSMPDIFDDDGLLFYTFKDSVVTGATPATPKLNKGAVLEQLEKWGLRFKVFYFGGETREINFDEFMGNNAYYNTVVLAGGAWNTDPLNPGVPVFKREDAVITADLVKYAGGMAIMQADEDSGNWNITLEYSPVNYRADTTQTTEGAWVTQVDVPIPVYVFDDTIVVYKNEKSGVNNIRINGCNTNEVLPDLNIKDNTEFTDAANAKWIFEGTYAYGRDRKQRAIKFNNEMFLWAELLRRKVDGTAYVLADNASSAVLTAYEDPTLVITNSTGFTSGVITNVGRENIINNAVASHPDYTSGKEADDEYHTKVGSAVVNRWPGTPELAVLRDHWIGVYYRGQYLSDEDAVIVDMINLLVPPASDPDTTN